MHEIGYGAFYLFIKKIARLVFPKYTTIQVYPKDRPVVYVSHHQNMLGPINILLWFPKFVRVWSLSVFTDQKTCYEHYINYTFTKRFKLPLYIAKPLAWIISYFVSALTHSACVVPVYRNSRRIIKTLKNSVQALQAGDSILIFPDIEYTSNENEVGDIYEGFLNIDKYYYRETGEHIDFIPIYANQDIKEILYGTPIRFDSEIPFIDQREEKAKELQESLNSLASITKQVDLV